MFVTLNCNLNNCVSEINNTSLGFRQEMHEDTVSNESDSQWIDSIDIDLNNSIVTPEGKQAVGYIAGYIITRLCRTIKCEICTIALLAFEKVWYHKLIILKDKGGLCYPSESVIEICLMSESVIRHAILMSGNDEILPKYTPEYLTISILRKLQGSAFINSFAPHNIEFFSSNADHSLLLIKAIINKYLKVRLYHETKMITLKNKGNSKRQFYNKLTLHSGF